MLTVILDLVHELLTESFGDGDGLENGDDGDDDDGGPELGHHAAEADLLLGLAVRGVGGDGEGRQREGRHPRVYLARDHAGAAVVPRGAVLLAANSQALF